MKAGPFCRLFTLLLIASSAIAQSAADEPESLKRDPQAESTYQQLRLEYEREQSRLRARIRVAQASAGRARLEAEAAQAEVAELNTRLSRLEAQASAAQAAEQAVIQAEQRRAEAERNAEARAEARRRAQAEAALLRHHRERAAAARELPGAPPNILRRALSTGEVVLMINKERLVFPDAASADAAEARALVEAAELRRAADATVASPANEGG